MNRVAATQASPLLSSLLGPHFHTAVIEGEGEGDAGWLTMEELEQLGVAGSKRRQEFAAGRACARHALIQAGSGLVSLPIGSDRQPRWPGAFIGSITHAPGLCAAAVAERRHVRAVGIDAEPLGRVTPELWPQICVEQEAVWLAGLPEAQRDVAQTLVFCAKEAFYKCQFAVTAQWLEFCDVALDLEASDLHGGYFSIRPVSSVSRDIWSRCPRMGRFALTQQHLLTAISLRA